MKDERELVLSKVRASLQSAHLPAARATIPARELVAVPPKEEMIASFRRELELVGGKSYLVPSGSQAAELTVQLLHDSANEYKGNEILSWDESELGIPDLLARVRGAGFEILDYFVPADPEARQARLAEMGRAIVGITGAQAGLADTGSIVLLSAPGRPRLASLMPPVHIAFLRVSELFPTIAHYFAADGEKTSGSSNLVFVTGPSRTADIELTLTRGVHGPKHVHVILIA